MTDADTQIQTINSSVKLESNKKKRPTAPKKQPLNEEILDDLRVLEELLGNIYRFFWLRRLVSNHYILFIVLIIIAIVLWKLVPGSEIFSATLLGALLTALITQNNSHEIMIGSKKPQERELNVLRDRIRRYWLEAELKPSLQEANPVNIDLFAQTNMVMWDKEREGNERSFESLNILKLFNKWNSFLILGDSGTGKTILLLQLATKLLRYPPSNREKSIPLILNLSSWSNKSISFEKWLLEEAERTYQIRSYTFKRWLDNNQFIFLLDGLDEIHDDARPDRIEKINRFRNANRKIWMVICCRTEDYQKTIEDNPKNKLHFPNAIELKKLTESQVKAYLQNQDKLESFRQIYKNDEIVKKLAKIPFLLVTMAYTYKNQPIEQLKVDGKSENARTYHLFDMYLTKLLQSDKFPPMRHTEKKIRDYLKWLSVKTTAFGTVFRMDAVTKDWFSELSKLGDYTLNMFLIILYFFWVIGFQLGWQLSGIYGVIGFSILAFFLAILTSLFWRMSDIIRYTFSFKLLFNNLKGQKFVKLLLPLFLAGLLVYLINSSQSIIVWGIGLLLWISYFYLQFPNFLNLNNKFALLSKFLVMFSMAFSAMLILYTLDYSLNYPVEFKIPLIIILLAVSLLGVRSLEPHKNLSKSPIRTAIFATIFVPILGYLISFVFLSRTLSYQMAFSGFFVAFLLAGGIRFLEILSIHQAILRKLPTRRRKFFHDMVKRQILRPMAGGYTFRHDYLRQSLLIENNMVLEQIQILIKELENENKGDKARESLARFGDLAIDFLIEKSTDKNPNIRANIAFIFGKIVHQKTIEPLLVQLKDEDWHVRAYAAMALLNINNEQTLESIINALPDENIIVTIALIFTLGQTKDKRGVDPLINLLQFDNLFLSQFVIIALGEIGDERAIDSLIPFLDEESIPTYDNQKMTINTRICDLTATALKKIGTLRAKQAIIDSRRDTK